MSNTGRTPMLVLYAGTDAALRVNLLEMLFQMHVPHDETRDTVRIEGRDVVHYRIGVAVESMALAVDLLDDMTRRLSAKR